jgi:hypothetical protein
MFNTISSYPMKIKIPYRLLNLHIQIPPSTHIFSRRPISSSRPCNNKRSIDEETLSDYNPSQYHPTKPGGPLGDGDSYKYTALVKLGYGRTSTTWLCKDHNKYVHTYPYEDQPIPKARKFRPVRILTHPQTTKQQQQRLQSPQNRRSACHSQRKDGV